MNAKIAKICWFRGMVWEGTQGQNMRSNILSNIYRSLNENCSICKHNYCFF